MKLFHCILLFAIALAALGASKSLASEVSPALEIRTEPARPAVLNTCQILLSAFDPKTGAAVTGRYSVEIRPVSRKLRQMESEWFRNVEPYEPGRVRILHNFRIAGDYELVGHIDTPSGESLEVRRPINVFDNGEVGFWSETWLKAGIFVAMTVVLFVLAGKFAKQSKPVEPDKPEASGWNNG